ncbi:MAG: hypothetical protein GXP41_04070 [Chloroflexi bacterium]|nr:hypothetical protein [Chloroflexota bacterium]
MVAKPIVDGLEKQLGKQAQVIRLDITQALGREAAMRYGVRAVPTFVILDGKGDVVQRYNGFLPAGKVKEQVRSLAS